MRWILTLVVVAAAGVGLWVLLTPATPPGVEGEYVFDVETGVVVHTTRTQGSGTIEIPVAVGVAGDVARPHAKMGEPDIWMGQDLVLPSNQQVTGKELLVAMGKLAPVRFRSQRELSRFEGLTFEPNLDEGDLILGSMFEGLITDQGFQMEARDHFIMVYDPEANEAFAKELRTRRDRRAAAKTD